MPSGSVHEKTREENWNSPVRSAGRSISAVPRVDGRTGRCETRAHRRLDAALRDWGDQGPWPTRPKPEEEVDLTHASRKVKQVIRAAGLRDELTFASFPAPRRLHRQAGDAELTDREIMARGRHKSPKVLPKYVKRTMKQVATGS